MLSHNPVRGNDLHLVLVWVYFMARWDIIEVCHLDKVLRFGCVWDCVQSKVDSGSRWGNNY